MPLLTWTHHIKNVCGNFETDFDGTRIYSLVRFSAFYWAIPKLLLLKNNANKIVRKTDEIDRVNNRFCF